MRSIAIPIRVPAIQFASAKVADKLLPHKHLPDLSPQIMLAGFVAEPQQFDKVA